VLCKADRPSPVFDQYPIERSIRIIEPAAGVSVIITLLVFHARVLLQKMEDGIYELP